MLKTPRTSARARAAERRPVIAPAVDDTPQTQDLPDEAEVQRIIAESERALRERPAGVSDSFAQYIHELQRYPVLSSEKEHELAVLAQRGSIEAQEALVRHNLRFVITVARKHLSHGVPLEDLVQEGNIGLMKAVTKFRPEFGVKFISYGVFWIRQAIRSSLAYQQRPVRLPINRATQLARIRRVNTQLTDELGRKPTAQELASAADVPLHMVKDLLRLNQSEVSLDAPNGTDDGIMLSEKIPSGADLEESIERSCRRRHIEEALGQLRERDATVLRLFFGIDGLREHTLEEIGHVLGVTRERVRQIRDRALKELRTLYGDALRDYIGTHYPEEGE